MNDCRRQPVVVVTRVDRQVRFIERMVRRRPRNERWLLDTQ
jgi:hypothetical protein